MQIPWHHGIHKFDGYAWAHPCNFYPTHMPTESAFDWLQNPDAQKDLELLVREIAGPEGIHELIVLGGCFLGSRYNMKAGDKTVSAHPIPLQHVLRSTFHFWNLALTIDFPKTWINLDRNCLAQKNICDVVLGPQGLAAVGFSILTFG